MPCWIYLRGDADAIVSNEAADVVLHRVEGAEEDAFIQVALTPLAHDDEARTGFIRGTDIVAVLPMHPRQFESELDDPPDWYSR
jgi:hypothetical protein